MFFVLDRFIPWKFVAIAVLGAVALEAVGIPVLSPLIDAAVSFGTHAVEWLVEQLMNQLNPLTIPYRIL